MRTGVHTSVRNGFVGALKDAQDLGCETFQMFTQSPRGWMTRVYEEQEFHEFRAARAAAGIFPVVVHAPYLPNLCTSDEDLYRKSLEALKKDLDRCEKLGADYLVIHPGAYSPESTWVHGLDRIGSAINAAFDAVPGRTVLLIENMAGGGRRIGGTWRDIKEIRARIRDRKRVAVCFDTCHALAAGYDLSTSKGVDEALKSFDKELGLDLIRVFHVNDSKGALGSHRDMHEHLGKGHVGLAGFRHLFGHPAFRDCAFILETPKEPIPQSDLENLRLLRSCLPKTSTSRKKVRS